MTRLIDNLYTEAQEIRLTGAERRRILACLREAMGPVPSPFFIHLQTVFAPRYAFAGVMMFVLAFTGTAYASQSALPGDLLYPVKVGVTEPIQGSVAFSDDAKIAWHTDVAETRLAEAEALTDNGTLTAETSKELAANVTEHAKAVDEIAHRIGADNPISEDKIAARFSSSLAHKGSAVLAAGKRTKNLIAMRASGDFVVQVASDTAAVPDKVAIATQESAQANTPAPVMMGKMTLMMTASEAVPPPETLENLAARAHAATETASSTLAAATLDEEDHAEALAQMGKLENLMVKAEADLQLESNDEATADFTDAVAVAEDLTTYVHDHETHDDDHQDHQDEDDGHDDGDTDDDFDHEGWHWGHDHWY